MLLSKGPFQSVFMQSKPRYVRKPIQVKAISMDATNIIVGIVALSVIVDVGKTFYKHSKYNKNKDMILPTDSDEEE